MDQSQEMKSTSNEDNNQNSDTDYKTDVVSPEEFKNRKRKAIYNARQVLINFGNMEERRVCKRAMKLMVK